MLSIDIEPLDHLVEAHQAVADIERRNRSRRRSRCGERIFRAVQRFLHCGEVDDACAALQRVKRAKGVVEALGVVRRFLERQQVVDGLVDELPRFDQKLLQELIHAGTPQSRAAYSTSVSCFSGLTT